MEYRMEDIFDLEFLQEFQDSFSKAVGISSISVNKDGTPVTNPSDFSEFCFDYTRKSELGLKKCMECDKLGGEKANATKAPAIYKCHAGLYDFAAPIILNGEQIGSMLGGQILTEEPDEEFYRKKAIEYDIDPDEYVAAVKKAYVLDMDRMEAAANLLYLVAGKISSMAHQKMVIDEIVQEVSDGISQISKTMDEITATSSDINKNQKELADSIKKIEKESKEIKKIVDIIDDISTQTNLLGINATIEAARSGEAGRGFSVVAQEIRNLSDTTRYNAEEIEKAVKRITENVDSTANLAKESLDFISEQTKSFEDVTQRMAQMKEQSINYSTNSEEI